MGTNYYVNTPPGCGGKCADHCHDRRIHLGKSSAGWAFTFRGYPRDDWDAETEGVVTWPVTDYTSWLRMLDLGEIRDEYGQPVSRDELVEEIDSKRGGRNNISGGSPEYLDADGNRFLPCDFS